MATTRRQLDPAANPYAPGAGIRPPLLAGRDRELADADRLLTRAGLGYADQPRLIVGVRGVGKTVLLLAVRDRARRAGAIAVHAQARGTEGFVQSLLRDLEFELRRVRGARGRVERALSVLAAVAVTVGAVKVAAQPRRGHGDSGDLAVDLLELFRAVGDVASAKQKSFVLTVDELQEMPDDQLSALLVALQRAAGESLPLATVVAGLPGVEAHAAAVESFAERMFALWRLGPLDDTAAARAVIEPALDAGGVEWEQAAVGRVISASGGYPFYLQHFAAAVWDTAVETPIRRRDADLGLQRAQRELADSIVRSRIVRLSARERRYVEALARLGPGSHGSGEVAAAIGVATSQVASARQRLIQAGVVYNPAYGEVAFTLPMFDLYVLRLLEDP
ncbi:MAG: ATP-binding protein [Euzebyales bacterium]|nr:ATP-binding protein [Euzebyales bacterium]